MEQKENWIEEFDEKFPDVVEREMEEVYTGVFTSTSAVIDISKEIKSFIRSLIERERAEGYKEGFDKACALNKVIPKK